ncbi:hypothetical protein, partial [Bradyrhizobium liaoningense]|uniref:hypothetical protein n=1 Tax=Bradyrhizobium liaoningense TaxID=43992 RepID=UPI001BACBA6F
HCWGPASRDAAASRARSLCGKIRAYAGCPGTGRSVDFLDVDAAVLDGWVLDAISTNPPGRVSGEVQRSLSF